MTDTITTEFVFEGKTATEWRAAATRCHQDAADSWERSDTDGFLSQWASGQMASRYEACARVAEAGGLIEQDAYIDLATGRLLQGTWEKAEYGSGWVSRGRWYFPSSAQNEKTRARNNEKKGLREVRVLAPAMIERGTGIPVADVDATWLVLAD